MDFFGGPRDGARQVVEPRPYIFVIPAKVNGEVVGLAYRYVDGAYHYSGQVVFEED